jgi:hypothetical protein
MQNRPLWTFWSNRRDIWTNGRTVASGEAQSGINMRLIGAYVKAELARAMRYAPSRIIRVKKRGVAESE